MKKILIIEDEENIRIELKSLLENNGYEVSQITDFTNTLDAMQKEKVDLILMDINIPNLNGEYLLKNYRKENNTPVIMVTSKNNEVDEVLSMSFGADDYITKPYNPQILLLRIQNIFKRMTPQTDVINYCDAQVFMNKGIIKIKDQEYILTKNEMIIFNYLINKRETIVTRDELMTELWNNNEYINDNALTVNISRLRAKLEEMGYDDAIETRKGLGYKLK